MRTIMRLSVLSRWQRKGPPRCGGPPNRPTLPALDASLLAGHLEPPATVYICFVGPRETRGSPPGAATLQGTCQITKSRVSGDRCYAQARTVDARYALTS